MSVEESRIPGEAQTAAAALSWMCVELGAIAGGDPFDPGLRDTLIALIGHNQDKVTALVEYTEGPLSRRAGRGEA